MREITNEFEDIISRKIDDTYFAGDSIESILAWHLERLARYFQVDSIADLKDNFDFLSSSENSRIAIDNVCSPNFHLMSVFDIFDINGDSIGGYIEKRLIPALSESISPGTIGPTTKFDLFATAHYVHTGGLSAWARGCRDREPRLIIIDIHRGRGDSDRETLEPVVDADGSLVFT